MPGDTRPHRPSPLRHTTKDLEIALSHSGERLPEPAVGNQYAFSDAEVRLTLRYRL
ncbi:MAG: hypothetical protein ACRDFS_10830 [Chloroflexota bacterium]